MFRPPARVEMQDMHRKTTEKRLDIKSRTIQKDSQRVIQYGQPQKPK